MLLFPVAILVLLDEWIKFHAIQTLPDITAITSPRFFELAIHKNIGLAFDIPFRIEFVIAMSVLIGFFLLRIAWKTWKNKPSVSFSCLLIVFGALGNLFDRIVYGFTIDYLLFFGRSAINFSDLVIMLGILNLLLSTTKKKYRIDNSPPIG